MSSRILAMSASNRWTRVISWATRSHQMRSIFLSTNPSISASCLPGLAFLNSSNRRTAKPLLARRAASFCIVSNELAAAGRQRLGVLARPGSPGRPRPPAAPADPPAEAAAPPGLRTMSMPSSAPPPAGAGGAGLADRVHPLVAPPAGLLPAPGRLDDRVHARLGIAPAAWSRRPAAGLVRPPPDLSAGPAGPLGLVPGLAGRSGVSVGVGPPPTTLPPACRPAAAYGAAGGRPRRPGRPRPVGGRRRADLADDHLVRLLDHLHGRLAVGSARTRPARRPPHRQHHEHDRARPDALPPPAGVQPRRRRRRRLEVDHVARRLGRRWRVRRRPVPRGRGYPAAGG